MGTRKSPVAVSPLVRNARERMGMIGNTEQRVQIALSGSLCAAEGIFAISGIPRAFMTAGVAFSVEFPFSPKPVRWADHAASESN